MWFGGNVRARFRQIENSIPDSPSRRKRRRSGGKRWDIPLRRTPVRERLPDERWSTLKLVAALLVTIVVLVLILFR